MRNLILATQRLTQRLPNGPQHSLSSPSVLATGLLSSILAGFLITPTLKWCLVCDFRLSPASFDRIIVFSLTCLCKILSRTLSIFDSFLLDPTVLYSEALGCTGDWW